MVFNLDFNMESEQALSRVQCTISDLALYRLPTNISIESIEFENTLLQCVKSNLNNRFKNADLDLNREMLQETAAFNQIENISPVDESVREKPSKFVVCVEPNRLVWSALSKSTLDTDCLQSSIRRQKTYMQISFREVNLCYVNIQLPNIVVWLLSSIPNKIVKNECLTAKCDNVTKHKSLFALVWKCFGENDVVTFRQVYKHLRSSTKKQPLIEHSPLTKSVSSDLESDQKKQSTEMDSNKTNNNISLSRTMKNLATASQYILSRQRQPARLIHENLLLNGAPPPAQPQPMMDRKYNFTNLSHKKGFLSSIRPFSIQSESEFDTTQMNNYLSHKPLKGSNKSRTRSRSVESPRRPFRLLYKPICDDIEILIPSYQTSKYDSLVKSHKQNEKNIHSKGYTDSLNSEGSSLSDESSSGDYVSSSLEFDSFHPFKNQSTKNATPLVIKSALKKSSSYFEGQKSFARMPRSFLLRSLTSDGTKSGFEKYQPSNARQCSNLHSKKNVTFSAYATVQVVDN